MQFNFVHEHQFVPVFFDELMFRNRYTCDGVSADFISSNHLTSSGFEL